MTYIGRSVTVAGRVCRGRKLYLVIESICEYHPNCCYFSPLSESLRLRPPVPCRSYNEELAHWNTALALRDSHYFINTKFVIPEATKPRETATEEPTPVYPTKHSQLSIPSPIRHAPQRHTPDPQEQVPSKNQRKPPVKLRHPTKVHKRDLTVNTLKIYLKDYMDNQPHANGDRTTLESSAITSDLSTERRRISTDALMPRPAFENRTMPVSFPEPIQKPRKRRKIDPEAGIRGLTMSYLRRVPELGLLAERIGAAEDKKKRREVRRAREEAKSREYSIPPKTEDIKSRINPGERTKRLFRQAIIKLCDEGSAILWDGPRRVWGAEQDYGSHLWHTNTTIDATASSVEVSNTGGNPYLEGSQDHEISEPDPKEESYVSLTPALLGKYVEKAIEEICSRKEKVRGPGHWGPKGPTLPEILSRLKADGRWRRIGECAVVEALQWLKDEERVWEVGGGHWELTI